VISRDCASGTDCLWSWSDHPLTRNRAATQKRHVDELLIVDPADQRVNWLALDGGSYEAVERSGLVELGTVELSARIDWPAIDDQSERR